MAQTIRKGDKVKVIAGQEKGKTGTVLEVLAEQGRVRVEGLMTIKRHLKRGRNQATPDGGIVEKTGSIALSNVMALGKDGKAVRREQMARELGAKEKARAAKRAAK
jgi:large subunit ribosomal protein L24